MPGRLSAPLGLRLGPAAPLTCPWGSWRSMPTSEKWRCLRAVGGLGMSRERPAHIESRGAALLPDRPASWGGWAPGTAAPSPAQEACVSAGCPRCRRAVGDAEERQAAAGGGQAAPVFHDRAGRRPLSPRSSMAQSETSITSFPVEEKPPQPVRGLGGPPGPPDGPGAGGVSSGIPPLPASPPPPPGPAPRRCWGRFRGAAWTGGRGAQAPPPGPREVSVLPAAHARRPHGGRPHWQQVQPGTRGQPLGLAWGLCVRLRGAGRPAESRLWRWQWEHPALPAPSSPAGGTTHRSSPQAPRVRAATGAVPQTRALPRGCSDFMRGRGVGAARATSRQRALGLGISVLQRLRW